MNFPHILAIVATATLLSKAAADFWVYDLQDERFYDGARRAGWQFFNDIPHDCEKIDLVAAVIGPSRQVRYEGTRRNPTVLEWQNEMGHFVMYKRDKWASKYILNTRNRKRVGNCLYIPKYSWACDYSPLGRAEGHSIAYCTSNATADAVQDELSYYGISLTCKNRGVFGADETCPSWR